MRQPDLLALRIIVENDEEVDPASVIADRLDSAGPALAGLVAFDKFVHVVYGDGGVHDGLDWRRELLLGLRKEFFVSLFSLFLFNFLLLEFIVGFDVFGRPGLLPIALLELEVVNEHKHFRGEGSHRLDREGTVAPAKLIHDAIGVSLLFNELDWLLDD